MNASMRGVIAMCVALFACGGGGGSNGGHDAGSTTDMSSSVVDGSSAVTPDASAISEDAGTATDGATQADDASTSDAATATTSDASSADAFALGDADVADGSTVVSMDGSVMTLLDAAADGRVTLPDATMMVADAARDSAMSAPRDAAADARDSGMVPPPPDMAMCMGPSCPCMGPSCGPIDIVQPALPTPPTSASPSSDALSTTSVTSCNLPNPNLITIGAVSGTGVSHVTGAAGAARPSSRVFIHSLPIGAATSAVAGVDGSFSIDIETPRDGSLVINCANGSGTTSWQQGGAALVMPVDPQEVTDKDAIPVSIGGPGADANTEYWIATGTVNGHRFEPRAEIEYALDFTYYTTRAGSAMTSALSNALQMTLVRFADQDGQPIQANFQPVLLTPTSMPIFHTAEISNGAWQARATVTSLATSSTTITAHVVFSMQLPADMPTGHYAPAFTLQTNSLFSGVMGGPSSSTPRFQQGVTSRVWGPVLRVGDPDTAHIPWVLLGNNLSNGTRGIVAEEDREVFHFGNKVTFNTDYLVVEPGTTHRLEPFLPTVSHHIGGPDRMVPPFVTFGFPNGEMSVSVRRPSGMVDELGSAPFLIGRAKAVGENFGPTSVMAVYELTTNDPRFYYEFAESGVYEVTMTGWTTDAIGNVYEGGGTYKVYAGQMLDLQLGTFENTPFEVGDVMSPAVTVSPAVPAEIEMTVHYYPNSDTSSEVTYHITGTANEHGYFHPGTAESAIAFSQHGEYRVDVTAVYRGSDETYWYGAATTASLIETPSSPIVAHGIRGTSFHTSGTPWFYAETLSGDSHEIVFIPYHSGDVLWGEDGDSGIFGDITMQDDSCVTVLSQMGGGGMMGGCHPSSDQLTVKMPEINNVQAVQNPAAISTWAYAYFSTMRPGVVVRSFVGSSQVQRGYWQFGDHYNQQLGNGSQGDRPMDVKLQYGGVVYRDEMRHNNYYAIYGSMTTMMPTSDSLGQRVFPPFQGNGGGPSGGPLLTIGYASPTGWQVPRADIDMFFTPAGVVPGTVLSVGDTISFSGVVWPTLPSSVEATVYGPTGSVLRTISGNANKVGAFYSRADDFVATDPGVYRIQVAVEHDGTFSAGATEDPFPAGGILGTTDGSYYFYVLADDPSSMLTVNTTGSNLNGSSVQLTPVIPSGVTADYMYVTVNASGTVLRQQVTTNPSSWSFTYNTSDYSTAFPNIDSDGSDSIDVTIVLQGRLMGNTVFYGRRVHFAAGHLITFD